MPIPLKEELQDRPVLGMWKRRNLSRIDPRYLDEAFNVDLYGGTLAARRGLRRVNVAAISGTQHGVFYARFNSGTKERLVAANTNIYRVTRVATALTQALPSDDPGRTGGTTHFVQNNDLVFACNGVDRDIKYNATAMQKWGISAPASVLTITPAAGSVTSTRRYIATYLNSVTGHEGQENTATTDQTLTAQQASAASPATPTDPQVDKWRLYAAVVVANRPGVYYRVGEATLTTAIVDNLSDAVLQTKQILEEFTNNPPSGPFFLIAPHQGRIVAVPQSDKSILYISDHDGFFPKPESFPVLNYMPISYRDGDTITALASMDDTLLIFKKFSIWAMIGYWPDIRLVSVSYKSDQSSLGTIDHRAVAVFEREVVFPSHDGIYRVEKGALASEGVFKSAKISDVIDDFYNQVDQNQPVHAAFDRSRRQYRLFCKLRTGQSVDAKVVIP